MRFQDAATDARHAIYAFLIAVAIVGGIDGHMKFQSITPPIWWDIASSAILALFAFGWYFLDSKDHCYRRSNLLNVAVFVLAAGAIPYYLAKSRAPGRRVDAVLNFVVFCGLAFVVSLIGHSIGARVG